MRKPPFRSVSLALLAPVAICACASPLDLTPDYYRDDRAINPNVKTALLDKRSSEASGVWLSKRPPDARN